MVREAYQTDPCTTRPPCVDCVGVAVMKCDRLEQRDGHWCRGAGGDVIVSRILERPRVPELAPGFPCCKIFGLGVFMTMPGCAAPFAFLSYPSIVHVRRVDLGINVAHMF